MGHATIATWLIDMGRILRFSAALTCVLGLLSWAAHAVLINTMSSWFERDLRLRSELAAMGVEAGLGSALSARDATEVGTLLTRISSDERIMGAAFCSGQGLLDVVTPTAPASLRCADIASRARAQPTQSGTWHYQLEEPGGPVRVSVHPLRIGSPPPVLALAQDLSFIARREQTARNLVLTAFFILALCASVLTLLAARLAWRHWVTALQQALHGAGTREFQPLVRHVRELVDRLVQEREHEAHAGRWTPERLRAALTEHLHGERIVVLANREPYIHEREPSGELRVVHPASGLVTALEPVMRACSGVWVAHGAGSADRETVDAHDRVRVPPGEDAYWLRRVWLTPDEESGYYYGFSNEGLWPLCHIAHTRPIFRSEDFEHYRRVNARFAQAVCEEVDSDDPIILIQDYHFALAPRMIQERLPRATILTFWHIPWPNAERFGICPWRTELVEGLLGSSIVGFHTNQHCNHFLDAVDAYVESRIDREQRAVVQQARSTLVRPYPISIEWPVRWLDGLPSVTECRREVLAELQLTEGRLLGLGVDRLDYTKGIEERLQAVDALLERHPEFRGRFTFVQLAAPSRTRIEHYRDLNDRVERIAAQINERWGSDGYSPIVLHRAHHEPRTVFRYYRAAHLCYVSSLHDGMNLVAKEYVAARDDEQGVLILSRFTGAARELTEALVVNPYDLRQASDAMAFALRMPAAEQLERMRSMRKLVSELNVYRWAGRMLVDAAQLRRRERLIGRLRNPDL